MTDQPEVGNMPQHPILLRIQGRIYVLPEPFQCVSRTTRKKRCSAWVLGLYDCVGSPNYLVSSLGVVEARDAADEAIDYLRDQRCKRHVALDASAHYPLEAELLDPQRHAHLIKPITDNWAAPWERSR